ncbi:hypothetical protein DAPPUDRAFT_322033 [Daphnia pulex]|uniref:Uncharacterized protein n=1 Tax=Daphnia pulex TaxID=6669 RepID=E9GUE2_DAPPU|nr:hypothetical protein DAPPUDRAFT_322033 [Daphnia pulex]|eukprot:EFX76863.1 hypothetical protein DAPPUDRAFT_322033 [Daphnia pulex]
MSPDKEIADKFMNCEALENVIRLLNNSFDVMNARRPKDGITRANWNGADGRHEILTKLFQCLEET